VVNLFTTPFRNWVGLTIVLLDFLAISDLLEIPRNFCPSVKQFGFQSDAKIPEYLSESKRFADTITDMSKDKG